MPHPHDSVPLLFFSPCAACLVGLLVIPKAEVSFFALGVALPPNRAGFVRGLEDVGWEMGRCWHSLIPWISPPAGTPPSKLILGKGCTNTSPEPMAASEQKLRVVIPEMGHSSRPALYLMITVMA